MNWCLDHSREEIFQRAQELRIPCGIGYSIGEVLNDPQLVSRMHFVKVDHPHAGPLHYSSLPIKSKTLQPNHDRAPCLGEHHEEIFGQMQRRIRYHGSPPMGEDGVAGEGLALQGLRVVDLTRAWAGPYTTSSSGRHGPPEVIKIESDVYPDVFRGQSSEVDSSSTQPEESSPWFHTINRNKLSLSLDLSQPDGKQTLQRIGRNQ